MDGAVWVVSERVSNVIGRLLGESDDDDEDAARPREAMTLDEVVDVLRADVEENKYFVTGEFTCPAVYSDDCEFVDDFSSFGGNGSFLRFRRNLRALAALTESYDVKVLSFGVDEEDGEVATRAFVNLKLRLPWRPVLAWVWRVRFTIDDSRVVRHVESWEIDRSKGVELLFKPGPEAGWPWKR